MTTKINKGSHETCHDSLPYFYITQDGARGAIYDKVSYIDGLAQDCSNSSALALELLQSCTKQSIYNMHKILLHFVLIL